MKNRKKILVLIGIALVITLIIGASYALWTITISQNEENAIDTECFKINFTDKNAISLDKVYPIEDAMGMMLTPYTFTITNVCNVYTKYQINIETMVPSGTKMPDKYLKANLSEGEISKITTKLDKSINSKLETETTISGAVEAYKLVTGIMEPGETKEFNLRIWMHSDVTKDDEDSMNSSFSGKVSIIASYYRDVRGTLMAYSSNRAFYVYKSNITKVVFEDEFNVKETDLVWDVSEEQDGSVMSYLVLNEDEETYTLYIQGDGGVKANSNSSYLFYSFTKLGSIEGLDYLDTRNVTDMSSMFSNCSSLTNLDLSNFDTSNVTTMSSMFYGCSSLTNLDLSNFDTSNVTTMSYMFSNCSSLTNLDLSNFDTSNVTTMSSMLSGCSSLTSLDLSNFDTSKVIVMAYMFYLCSSLTNLDVSNFDTSNVTTMGYMFSNCSSLTNLNLSSFDTSKVTNMSSMFSNCSSLISLDLSSFNTSNVTVTTMVYMFLPMPNEAKIYVNDVTTQSWILNLTSINRPTSWTTDNVIIKG